MKIQNARFIEISLPAIETDNRILPSLFCTHSLRIRAQIENESTQKHDVNSINGIHFIFISFFESI